MPCDYEAIRRENIKEYGEGIGRFGRPWLAGGYADRTHFIFELLQNAEDALARRKRWQGSQAVVFELQESSLRVRHCGDPFNEDDVKGICGIDESTKEFNEIGRFGIGFKSVYAFTDRPEIHSGSEDFAVEEFVRPIATGIVDRHVDETVIQIPFKPTDNSAPDKITDGLKRLGGFGLLFLRQIDEIAWSAEGGASGRYLREEKGIDSNVRRVTIIGQQDGKSEVDEEWLVFSRPVTTDDGDEAKPVEIAFSCAQDEESSSQRVRRVDQSPLVVFFPTDVETHLGFLVQGPYITTPSRDNIARDDDWNRSLVVQTASLLRDSLCWLRDQGLLDTEALRCLPLDSSKFGDTSMFAPLFDGAKDSLSSRPLLPCSDGGYVEATRARLGRTRELRDLFNPTQLTTLYEEEHELAWLSGDITQDRAHELRSYLKQELNVAEIDPEDIIRRLNRPFLEAQPDDWILKLYEFLNGQQALRRNRWFATLSLVRLQDGKHVPAKTDDKLLAFLPTEATTGFPTVRGSVCATEPARAFLQSLGLKEPDPVDDVIENVLPTYRENGISIDDARYSADVRRILDAFDTDSGGQRNRLINSLKKTRFVRAVDAGDSSKCYVEPGEVYLATERLKSLFEGVVGILLVDDSQPCLHGENIRDLLERCGAVRYLRPIRDDTLSYEERDKLREKAGYPETSGRNDHVADQTLKGLEELLAILPTLDVERQRKVASLLWNELANLEERRGKDLFTGNYTWTYYGNYKQPFDAAFVRRLNTTHWVPDADGKLHRPEFVSFDSQGWSKRPFLESKIHFKPPIAEMLAQEFGIEPEVLELLKERGLTNMSNLLDLLGSEDEPIELKPDGGDETSGSAGHDHGNGDSAVSSPGVGAEERRATGGQENREGGVNNSTSEQENWRPEGAGAWQFVSYVAVHPGETEPDPDDLDQGSRMKLEAKAIELIRAREPDWQQTPSNNPGYDLYEVDEDDQPIRWCEVKAMKGSLQDRPVGLSSTQFDFARKYSESYWLYVVEHAGDEQKTRVVRIQDPAGKARTFTFDRGWLDIST